MDTNLSYAWDMFKKDPFGWVLVNVCFGLVVLFSATVGLVLAPNYYRAIIKALPREKAPPIAELFRFDNIVNDALTILVFVAVNFLGTLCFGLGAIWTTPYSIWMLHLCAEKRFEPLDCFRASMAHSRGKIISIWIYYIILFLFSTIVSLVTCGLGAVVVGPLLFIETARSYEINRTQILADAQADGLILLNK